MEINPDTNEYATRDTSLAAYLITQGFEHLTIRYNDSGIGTHIFEDNDPRLQDDVMLYRKCEAVVNIAIYENTRRKLLYRVKHQLP